MSTRFGLSTLCHFSSFFLNKLILRTSDTHPPASLFVYQANDYKIVKSFFTKPKQYYRLVRKFRWKNHRGASKCKANINSNKYYWRGSQFSKQVRWSRFIRFRDTRRTFFFVPSGMRKHLHTRPQGELRPVTRFRRERICRPNTTETKTADKKAV